MLRPGSVPAIARHIAWRAANALRWSLRTARKADWSRLAGYAAALPSRETWGAPVATASAGPVRSSIPARTRLASPSSSHPVPARNCSKPNFPASSHKRPAQIVVVDNGSTDGTAEWLASTYPQVEVVHSEAPLSFARAVNRGIARARCSHICLLNNDMLLEPGFFAALRARLSAGARPVLRHRADPFPAGVRREETGKTVFAQTLPTDFPVRCDEPLPGEDGTWVLYGSGGCSLYDAAKLRELGSVDEVYEPAYVEDLDLGYRAWQRGWPSVYVAGAVVEHRHRATTTRYYTEEQLSRILEINYLRFVARAVSDAKVFRRLWAAGNPPAVSAEEPAVFRRRRSRFRADLAHPPSTPRHSFSRSPMAASASSPGVPPTGRPRVLVASPYLPFPLSHGGAVRMYNLMRRAAEEFDLVLVAFTEHAAPPPPEILDICAEIVLVRRAGSHALPFTGRPEVVEEFASAAFRAALQQTVRKWRPGDRPTGIHPTRAVRRRLRSRPHHPGGARRHVRSVPAAPAVRRSLGTSPRIRPLAQVRDRAPGAPWIASSP